MCHAPEDPIPRRGRGLAKQGVKGVPKFDILTCLHENFRFRIFGKNYFCFSPKFANKKLTNIFAKIIAKIETAKTVRQFHTLYTTAADNFLFNRTYRLFSEYSALLQ
jgi:hypothetical protein